MSTMIKVKAVAGRMLQMPGARGHVGWEKCDAKSAEHTVPIVVTDKTTGAKTEMPRHFKRCTKAVELKSTSYIRRAIRRGDIEVAKAATTKEK